MDENEILTELLEKQRKIYIEEAISLEEKIKSQDAELQSLNAENERLKEKLNQYEGDKGALEKCSMGDFKSLENTIHKTERRIMKCKIKRKCDTDKGNDQNCIVCRDNKKDALFLPCGHVCCCCECGEKLDSKCPLCRSSILKTMKIFLN